MSAPETADEDTTPAPTTPTAPAEPSGSGATPPGPPRIPFHRGRGRPVGALARSAYTAHAFTPIPPTFRRGGIPAGSRAGPCRVIAPTRRDHRQLTRLVEGLHPDATLQGIFDEHVLLAACGRRGAHGLLVWTRIAPDRDRITDLIQLVRRDGRWRRARARAGIGCTVPRAAASAWRIDVSPCPRGR